MTTTWPGPQLWTQHLVEIGEEDLAISGRLDRHRSQDAGVVESAEDRKHLPVASGHRVLNSVAAHGTSVQTGHLGGDAAFVEVDQVFGCDPRDGFKERFAPLPVGFGIALGGVDRLFLSRMPILRSTLHSCAGLAGWPESRSAWLSSRKTMSGFVSTMRRTCPVSIKLGRRRCGTRRRLPVPSSAAWILATHP